MLPIQEIEQIAFRSEPYGQNGKSVEKLNELFAKGWLVKLATPEPVKDKTYVMYILERIKPKTI